MNQRIFTYLLLQMTTSSATACCCEKKMCEENPGHIITNQICIPHNLVPPSGSSSSSSVIGRPTQSIRIPPLHHYIEQHVATTMRHDAMRPHSYLRTWSAVGIYGPPPPTHKGHRLFQAVRVDEKVTRAAALAAAVFQKHFRKLEAKNHLTKAKSEQLVCE
jgi:hypothetical protein